MSTDSDPTTFSVTATSSSNNSITCESATGLVVNDPVIFTGTTFGGIVAGTTYYVREIFSGNTSFSIAATFNGSAVTLTDAAGSCTLTNQTNALVLTTASGSMTLNVGLPVSPGQVDGQEFEFYETSIPYSNVSGTASNLLTRTISSTLSTVNRICLVENLTNIYNNLEFNIASDVGGLTVAGEPYTVNGFDTTTVIVSNTVGAPDNWLTLPVATNPNTTDVLYVGMPIVFTGTSLGGISIGVTYYVYSINASPSTNTGQFTISQYSTLDEVFAITTGFGTMTGTGDNYLTISGGYSLINSVQTATITNASPAVVTVTDGGAFPNGTAITFGTYGNLPVPLNDVTTYYVINSSGNTFNVSYSSTGAAINTLTAGLGPHRVSQTNVILTQQTISDPVFDVRYLLGGYSTAIISNGSGYAVNNTITIPGTLVGGTTTANDLVLTVDSINSTGGVTSTIASGTPNGLVSQYYLKVLSENQMGVYSNPNLTVAVSGENFPYIGTISTAATATSSSNNRVTVTSSASFVVNDAIVFTGTTFGNIVLGQTYYVASTPTATTVTISETISGTTFVLATSSGADMIMAKSGDFIFLSEPFFFTPSIVKYNNSVYQCIISNNDVDFIFGKWELLTSGDKKLNALDRIVGYYQPTVNMPGVDLTQLVTGITYPNSTYTGNAFAPDDEYELNILLQDQPFYPVGIDLKAIIWNGLVYIAVSDAGTYSAVNVSADATDWSINQLANQELSITDLIYAGGSYVITTNNNATPILISDDGVTWSSTGAFNVPAESLNNIIYQNTIYVAVGQNIVTSSDLDSWTERYAFTNGLTNIFNGVCYASTAGFTGYIAIGLGQQVVGDTAVNVAIIYSSLDAFTWTQVSFTATSLGFNSIAANSQTIVAVGDDGIIYTSFNGTTWFVQSSTVANTLNHIIWDNYNSRFVAVGDNGTILTGTTNGVTWTNQTSGVSTTLESVVWNNTALQYVVVGLDNTILTSANATAWTASATFETAPVVYSIQGDDFTQGYGPEELVPGVIADTIMMTVATRPGTNWDETVYQHVGYNTVSTEITPTDGSQVIYSFENLVTIPAQLAVFVINRTTNLSTSLYNITNYTVDWYNKTITLNTPITYIAPGNTDRLRIDVYEVGNGDQLVKANTETDALRLNTTTGFQEIYVNANFSASIRQGSGVIRPDTSPISVDAISTSSTTNAITCDNVTNFVLNSSVTFIGAVFGNIVENQVYYVKSIGLTTNRITISDTYNISTGTAGETFLLTDATGIMEAVIAVGTGLPWTTPSVLYNGNSLVLGTYASVVQTSASTNVITTISTGGLIVNTPVVFSSTMFGNITPQVVYYVHSIVNGNDFTISATQGGSVLVLTDAVGGATLISNDYAFTVADNGTTAALVFANTYDVTTDYLTYTIMGETLPVQYGYTLPQVQLFTGNNSTVSFTLTNYVGDNNPNNAIVEIDGIRQTQTAYTISSISNTILFSSPPPAASTVAVTTYNQTQRQYLNTQYNITGSTVSNIVNIDNSLSTVRVVTGINHNFAENDLIRIDGVSGSIQLNNNTYYVNIINSTEFDLYNQPYNPAATNYPVTGVSAYTSGGYAWLDQLFTVIDTVATRTTANGNRITVDSTDIIVPNTPVLFTTFGANIGDNILGGILANTQYYVYEVNPTILAGNFIVGNSYQIIELGTTDFTTIGAASNTVSVIFTATGVGSGTGLASGLQEFTITSDRYPNQAQVVLTDATGSINVSEFEQVNVDRLWVTVDGYRVPSSALKLNLFNNLSILTTIQTGDQVIITSMMPTATPNEQVYLLNVSMSNEPTVYRANTQARTWLTQPLLFTDTTIYLHDVTHVTDNVVQNVICPAAVDGKYNIGLTADKNAICLIVVYNETTSTMVNPANFTIIIVDTSPILQISSQVTVGDSLTITSTVGRFVYINGEQIAFSECDLDNNTLSQLIRGANGTGVREYTPIYTEVFGLIPSNAMSDVLYSTVWNPIPGIYNTTEGDPLQIAYSQGADFLRTDRN